MHERHHRVNHCYTRWIDRPNGVLRRFQQYIKSYHGNSSHYSCLSSISQVLVWGSAVSCPRILLRKKKKKNKPQRIQSSSNPGTLDYDSNTEPRRNPKHDGHIHFIMQCFNRNTHPLKVIIYW